MSLNRIMNQGKTALAATQLGLNTVSHNIANVGTEGYSRQRVDFTTADPVQVGKHRIGGGVQVGAVTRASSEFVNRRLEEEATSLGNLEGQSETMTQLETIFKDAGDEGLSKTISRFFNDIRTLSTQPESQPLRAAVREAATSLTSKFHSLVNGAEQVRNDVERRVTGAVTDVNMLTKRIADLNGRIMEIEANTGTYANDERDSRDVALKELSKIVTVEVVPIDHGGINVTSGRLGVLVNATESSQYRALQVQGEDGADGGGAIRIFELGHNDRLVKDVTGFVESGSLGGFLRVRDGTLPGIMDKLNSLAHGLMTSVNEIHQEAYGILDKKGMNFFEVPDRVSSAALGMKLSESIFEDPGNIASGYKKGAAGDNRALLQLADLQDKKVFNGGTATFMDQASSIIGSLGVDLKSVNTNLETQQGLCEQLGTIRDRIAGVSLDEEAIHLMQFQKAFDANAKTIQVADNLMDTVLNLKRF